MSDFYYSRVFPNGAIKSDAPKVGDMIVKDGRAVIIGSNNDEPCQNAKSASFCIEEMQSCKFAEIEADGLIYTAKKAGNAGNNIKVVHKVYKSAHDAGVSVKGNIITVVLTTDSKGNIIFEAEELQSLINSDDTLPITIDIEEYRDLKAGEYKLSGGADAPLGDKGELRFDDKGLYLCNGEEWLTIKEF